MEHGDKKCLCPMGADYLTVKTGINEVGHPADMINVGVGEKQIINFFRCHGKGFKGQLRIMAHGFSAVHKNVHSTAPGRRNLHQVTRTRNTVFCAEMINFHVRVFLHKNLLLCQQTTIIKFSFGIAEFWEDHAVEMVYRSLKSKKT